MYKHPITNKEMFEILDSVGLFQKNPTGNPNDKIRFPEKVNVVLTSHKDGKEVKRVIES